MAWKALGRLSPVTSYSRRERRAPPRRGGPRIAAATSVGLSGGGPKSAVRATRSAAVDVLLHQHRRERQHVADVVEAVARVVLREVVGRPRSTPSRSRIVLLYSVRFSRRAVTRPGSGGVVRSMRSSSRSIQRGDGLPRVLVRLRLVFGRHLASRSLPDDFFPRIRIVGQGADRRERLEVDILLLFLVAVAGVAVLGQERLDDRVEAGRPGGEEPQPGAPLPQVAGPTRSWPATARAGGRGQAARCVSP